MEFKHFAKVGLLATGMYFGVRHSDDIKTLFAYMKKQTQHSANPALDYRVQNANLLLQANKVVYVR
jgi:hypothetical protein